MPIADLPYKIEKLTITGQYAYLGKTIGRKTQISKLRILRTVTLCDGPILWELVSEKHKDETFEFYVSLRLFATKKMVDEYLACPELQNYCSSKSKPVPSLSPDDLIVSQQNFASEKVQDLIFEEYKKMLLHKDSFDELISQLNFTEPEIADDKKKKKRSQPTLKEQLVVIQSTPSRLIDVSAFGETMKQQKGKVLERLQHSQRIAKCIQVSEDFPVISDNFPAFKRAMESLGPRYVSRIEEFKVKVHDGSSHCNPGPLCEDPH